MTADDALWFVAVLFVTAVLSGIFVVLGIIGDWWDRRAARQYRERRHMARRLSEFVERRDCCRRVLRECGPLFLDQHLRESHDRRAAT